MIALRLVRLIEKHSDDLARGLMQKIATRAELAGMREVPPDEVLWRVHEIYRHLGEWLLDRTDADVARRYEEIGRRRARQGVPLSTLVAAIAAVKGQLWEFLKSEAAADTPVEIFGEVELLERIDRFFDKATIHAVHGYERVVEGRAA